MASLSPKWSSTRSSRRRRCDIACSSGINTCRVARPKLLINHGRVMRCIIGVLKLVISWRRYFFIYDNGLAAPCATGAQRRIQFGEYAISSSGLRSTPYILEKSLQLRLPPLPLPLTTDIRSASLFYVMFSAAFIQLRVRVNAPLKVQVAST